MLVRGTFSKCLMVVPLYLATYVKRVMAITPDDVRRSANQYLTPDKMTLVIVGDTKTVQDHVAPWSKR
jgi:predicted Zn-dependent peptidase